jgi:hypothetical protein
MAGGLADRRAAPVSVPEVVDRSSGRRDG